MGKRLPPEPKCPEYDSPLLQTWAAGLPSDLWEICDFRRDMTPTGALIAVEQTRGLARPEKERNQLFDARAALERMIDERCRGGFIDFVANLVDEHFGTQPVMTPEELCVFLEAKLFEQRQAYNAARRAVGEAWFAGTVTMAEAIRRKTEFLERRRA